MTRSLDESSSQDASRMVELSRRITMSGLLHVLVLASIVAQTVTTEAHTFPTSSIESIKRPNIVFILTDDQDLHLDSLKYMPYVKQHLVEQGMSFNNHYCTVALCCPSRVSLWTGKHAHNTNVTDINPPHGGYPKFVSQGFNDNYFPLWMQSAGYDTYYIGKLFNAQSTSNYNRPYPRGWNGSDFLLDPFTYEYLNATFQRNSEIWGEQAVHEAPKSFEGRYVTDVLAKKSIGFLEDAVQRRHGSSGNGRPFFITIAPTAPHSNVHINVDLSDGHKNYSETTATQSPPVAAERHQRLFQDAKVPRTPDFNPVLEKSVSWLKSLPRQNQTNIDSNDHFYRQRLRALQSVDEMVDQIVNYLEASGNLEETYIFYSSDNGYHIGQHRLQPGKQCVYETDINIPLIVRGPGISAGQETNVVSSHVDLAPTFLQLAGIATEDLSYYQLDGQPINLSIDKHQNSKIRSPSELGHAQEHINIEMWGVIMSEGTYGSTLYPYHTYKALRIIAADESYSLLYVVWCTNEHELYDLKEDPYAMKNIYEFRNTTHLQKPEQQAPFYNEQMILDLYGNEDHAHSQPAWSLDRLVDRLDALMMVLKTCRGRQCTHPWEELFLSDDSRSVVSSLAGAMDSNHDEFFAHAVEKVTFDTCEQAYVKEHEGAQWKSRGIRDSLWRHELLT